MFGPRLELSGADDGGDVAGTGPLAVRSPSGDGLALAQGCNVFPQFTNGRNDDGGKSNRRDNDADQFLAHVVSIAFPF